MNENYEKFKKELVINLGANGRGKLALHKNLILQMLEDNIPQKDMRKFLKQEFNLEVSQPSFSLFIKKLKSNKIVKMELINGTNFAAALTTPIKEKKLKSKKIPTSENETNSLRAVETNKNEPITNSDSKELNKLHTDSENNNEQNITKKLVLNLPTRKIKTGEIVRVDRSQFK